MRRGVYGTLGSAPQFKTNPLCRVVCKLTKSCFPFSCPRLNCYPQLYVFHSAPIGRPRGKTQRSCGEKTWDVLRAVNLTSALTVPPVQRPGCQPTSPHVPRLSRDFPQPGKKSRNTIPQPQGFRTSFMSLHRWRSWTPVRFVCTEY